MKNLSKLLQKSNLTPKERVMALIKNDIHREKTGEHILSESDVYALSDSWSPKTSAEAESYNKYWHMWDNFVKLGMDMQTIYFTTLLSLSEIEKILILFFFREDVTHSKEVFEKNSTEEEQDQVRQYLLQNTGIDYGQLIHRTAFTSLPESLQEDMKLLHPEAEYDSSFFDEEEELFKILDGKDEMTDTEVTQLTNLLLNSISWDKQEFIASKNLHFTGMVFNSYYAGIQLLYFGKKLAIQHGFDYEDKKQLIEWLSGLKNLRQELKEVITESIESGFFETEYTPLFSSKTYETYSGKTKLQHHTIFKRWLDAKQQATAEIEKYVADNGLEIKEMSESIYDITWTKTVVTGESLYYADDSLKFVQEFKQQIELLMSYGMMIRALEVRDITKEYGNLLQFREVAHKVSQIVDDDASHYAEKYLDQIDEKVQQLNQYLYGIIDKMAEGLIINHNFTFQVETFFDDLIIDLSSIKSKPNKSLKVFEERVKKYLGSEWQGNQ